MQHEAKFGVLFRHWLKENPMHTATFELKDTRGKNNLSWNALQKNQIDYAQAIKKVPVLIRVQGTNGEPDYIFLNLVPAYIVVKFPKEFHIIDIDDFLTEKYLSKRKSLTIEISRKIAYHVVILKK